MVIERAGLEPYVVADASAETAASIAAFDDLASFDAGEAVQAARVEGIPFLLWLLYGGLALTAFIVGGEGSEWLRLPWYLVALTAAWVISTGWRAWPTFLRDPAGWGIAAVAALLAWGATLTGAWFGELMTETVTRPWRWLLEWGLMAAWTTALARNPQASPAWLVSGLERSLGATRGEAAVPDTPAISSPARGRLDGP